MSQSTNFEAAETVSGITSAARDARTVLSEEFSSNLADAFRKLTAPNPDASPSLDNLLPKQNQTPRSDSGSSDVPTPGASSPSISDAIKNAIKNSLENGKSGGSDSDLKNGQLSDLLNDLPSEKKLYSHSKFDVSDKDRRMAKEQLSRGLSELIPEADRKLLTQLQGAVIDGDVAALKAGLKQLADDPVKMEKFMNTLNSQLDGIELSKDGQGNVLMYEKTGNTALSITPSTGETSVRAVERQKDGSVLLKPGEIINRNVLGVAKSIGDEVTRNLTGFDHRYNWKQELLNGAGNSGGASDIQPKPGIGSLLEKAQSERSPSENSVKPNSIDKPKQKIEK